MMDRMEKFVMMQRSCMEESNEDKKFCIDCNTSKTPLWRGGPAGPKSLCNACGIKYRKKRRALLNLNSEPENKKRKLKITITSTAITTARTTAADYAENGGTSSDTGDDNGLKELRLKGLANNDASLSSTSTSSVVLKKQRCKKGMRITEEEQAAYALMALSRDFV